MKTPLLGTALFALGLLSVFLGRAKNESAILVLGCLLSIFCAFCLLSVLLHALFLRKKAAALALGFARSRVPCGQSVRMTGPRAFKAFCIPPVIARIEVKLSTKDGKKMILVLPPEFLRDGVCAVDIAGHESESRGAYRLLASLLVSDLACLFCVRIKIPQTDKEPLRVYPVVEKAKAFDLRANINRQEEEWRGLFPQGAAAESRPYVPGDDPRRINWKLFGHTGAGGVLQSGLFVREDEKLQALSGEVRIAVDTFFPEAHFRKTRRRLADKACEDALSTALALRDAGCNIILHYRGAEPALWTQKESEEALASLFALPYAVTDRTAVPAMP
jgi:hypothetical protein